MEFILGISITLNLILILGATLYFKKLKYDFIKQYFLSDEEIDDKLERM